MCWWLWGCDRLQNTNKQWLFDHLKLTFWCSEGKTACRTCQNAFVNTDVSLIHTLNSIQELFSLEVTHSICSHHKWCGTGLGMHVTHHVWVRSSKLWPGTDIPAQLFLSERSVDASQPFAALLLPLLQKFVPKTTVNYYIQTKGVSGVTSACKWILKSHKSPSYPTKGWRRAAAHEQHCRTLQLILSFSWGGASASSRGLLQGHQGQVSITGSAGRQRTKQNHVDEMKKLERDCASWPALQTLMRAMNVYSRVALSQGKAPTLGTKITNPTAMPSCSTSGVNLLCQSVTKIKTNYRLSLWRPK